MYILYTKIPESQDFNIPPPPPPALHPSLHFLIRKFIIIFSQKENFKNKIIRPGSTASDCWTFFLVSDKNQFHCFQLNLNFWIVNSFLFLTSFISRRRIIDQFNLIIIIIKNHRITFTFEANFPVLGVCVCVCVHVEGYFLYFSHLFVPSYFHPMRIGGEAGGERIKKKQKFLKIPKNS